MKLHLVWAVTAAGQKPVSLYCGFDGAEAEAVFQENHLDGDFQEVKWSTDVRHFRHSTPAQDNCKSGHKCQRPDAEAKAAAEAKKAQEAEAKRLAAEAKKAEAEAKKKADQEAKAAKAKEKDAKPK